MTTPLFLLQFLRMSGDVNRGKATEIILADPKLQLHLRAIETCMDLADTVRQLPTEDEDIKVIKMLGMRLFNAFSSSLALAITGYFQNAALILRDVLETLFLIDLFSEERTLIAEWRVADNKKRKEKFGPAAVRKALDDRYKHTGKMRERQYKMLSDLAGHPSMKSAEMMRPEKGGDAVIGPFMEARTLGATLAEAGRMAVQVGEVLNMFLPGDWPDGFDARRSFELAKYEWIKTFYPIILDKSKSPHAPPGVGG